MSRSGAVWCSKHERWECSANKADHHATAMRGMAYCRHHVGMATELARTRGEANLAAWSTMVGDQVQLDPGEVVMSQLRVAVMRADLYGERLRLQVEVEGVSGVVGITHAAGGDGVRVETGEQVRGLARLEADWRDRAVRYAETAHRMGIAERHVQLEQERAAMVTAAFMAALDVGGLVPEVRTLMVDRFLAGLGELVPGEVVA